MQYEVSELLRVRPAIKPVGYEPWYMDNHDFYYDESFCYIGLLNSGHSYQTRNVVGSATIMHRKANPVLFSNIAGDFTFIGYRIKIVLDSDEDLAAMPPFSFGDFNNDFSFDFSV